MTSANRSNMMSAVTCGIMLLASTAFCAMIGDFAPTTVGTKWVYSYWYSYYDVLPYIRHLDSLTISITVSSKLLQGNDTVIVLSISEQGRKLYETDIGGPNTDSTGTWNFNDTAVASGDSIVPGSYNHSGIFPFYKHHMISQDSLEIVLFNNDSVFRYGYSSEYFYYQNIGLFVDNFVVAMMNHSQELFVKLISFSNKDISIAAKPFVNKPAARPVTSFRHAVIILDGNQMRKDGMYYDVSGKRISSRQYHGVLLEKIENP